MFHAQDGWCFERKPDGSVRIVKFNDARCNEADIETEIILDSSTWCSTIASMSREGETAGKWAEANRFHEKIARCTAGNLARRLAGYADQQARFRAERSRARAACQERI